MKNPVVSVITPTFNRAELLKETVGSILNQTFKNFEYIVVDDGSADHTQEVLRSFRDSRIRVIRQSNQGEVSAINNAWSIARGKYIAIVSSDDPMLPLWLDAMVETLEGDPAATVAYPDWIIIDEEGETDQVIRTPDYQQHVMTAEFKAPAGPGALIRKSAGDLLSPPRRSEFRYCADLDMWLRLSMIGHLVRVPKVLATWRSHPESISVAERTRRRAEELVALAHEFFARKDLPVEVDVLKTRGIYSAYKLAAWVVEQSDPAAATEYLRRAKYLYPSD